VDGLIFSVCALFTAVAAAVYFRHLYTHRHVRRYRIARWARISACLACCFGSALAVPTIAQFAASATGIDHVAKLGAHLAAITFCASLQIMIVDWTHLSPHVPPGITLRLALLLSFAVALSWQFSGIDTNRLTLTTDFADDSRVSSYLLTYLAFAAASGLEIAILSTGLALAAHKQRRASAAGLALSAVGGGACVAYAISKGGYLIAYRLGHPWPLGVEKAISSPLAGVYILCVTVGLCLAIYARRAEPAAPCPPPCEPVSGG
jgi:hypothetical protein